jgi:hypothetical protein
MERTRCEIISPGDRLSGLDLVKVFELKGHETNYAIRLKLRKRGASGENIIVTLRELIDGESCALLDYQNAARIFPLPDSMLFQMDLSGSALMQEGTTEFDDTFFIPPDGLVDNIDNGIYDDDEPANQVATLDYLTGVISEVGGSGVEGTFNLATGALHLEGLTPEATYFLFLIFPQHDLTTPFQTVGYTGDYFIPPDGIIHDALSGIYTEGLVQVATLNYTTGAITEVGGSGVAGSFNFATGTLTLTGLDPEADYSFFMKYPEHDFTTGVAETTQEDHLPIPDLGSTIEICTGAVLKAHVVSTAGPLPWAIVEVDGSGITGTVVAGIADDVVVSLAGLTPETEYHLSEYNQNHGLTTDPTENDATAHAHIPRPDLAQPFAVYKGPAKIAEVLDTANPLPWNLVEANGSGITGTLVAGDDPDEAVLDLSGMEWDTEYHTISFWHNIQFVTQEDTTTSIFDLNVPAGEGPGQVAFPIISGSLKMYSDAEMTSLVAHEEGGLLVEDNDSGITGTINLADGTGVAIGVDSGDTYYFTWDRDYYTIASAGYMNPQTKPKIWFGTFLEVTIAYAAQPNCYVEGMLEMILKED